MNYKIVNIVAYSKIKGNIDIETLSYLLPNSQYEPEQFPGLIYRKEEYTIIMFFSGKISSHGTKTIQKSKKAIINVIEEITGKNCILGSKKHEKIIIVNIVSTADMKRRIDVESFSDEVSGTMYEPEQFPGVIFKPYQNSLTALIFRSGKIVVVGAKNRKSLLNCYKLLSKTLKKYVIE